MSTPSSPWVIVGAGPVGSMQAVVLATLFPAQAIFVLDKRQEHVRNHGLQIWNSTINDICDQLAKVKKILEKKEPPGAVGTAEAECVLANIQTTTKFLQTNFHGSINGVFVKTKTISIKLQELAEKLAEQNVQALGGTSVKFCQGPDYLVTEEILNGLLEKKEGQQDPASTTTTTSSSNLTSDVKIEEVVAEKEASPASSNNATIASPARQLLERASVIIAADGSHSSCRKVLFGEEYPATEVIQHLIEIKLSMKPKKEKKQSSLLTFSLFSSSINKSSVEMESIEAATNYVNDFFEKSLLPTLTKGKLYVWNEGKDGTATLHILIEKPMFDELRSLENENGSMGTYQNPFTSLEQLPKHPVKDLITEALNKTIGKDNFVPGTVRITTIPMQIYIANKLTKVENKRLCLLVGDSAVGLIFVRGVNNGLQCAGLYGHYLFKALKDQAAPQSQIFTAVPESIVECQDKIKTLYDEKVQGIKREKLLLDAVKKTIEKSKKVKQKVVTSFSKEADYS